MEFLVGAVSGLIIAFLAFVFDARLGLLPAPFAKFNEQYDICATIQDLNPELFFGTSTEPSSIGCDQILMLY
jgi:hypothetical protein